ncbi:MAG: hypothetical protein ACKV2V_09900 [Blastocatellia bacterium]
MARRLIIRSVFVNETTRNGRSVARFTGSGIIFDGIPTVKLRGAVGYILVARIRAPQGPANSSGLIEEQ